MEQPKIRIKSRPDCEYYKKIVGPFKCEKGATLVFAFNFEDIGVSRIAWFDVEPFDSDVEGFVINSILVGMYQQLVGDPIPLKMFLQMMEIAPSDSGHGFKFDTIASGWNVLVTLTNTDKISSKDIALSLTVFCPNTKA